MNQILELLEPGERPVLKHLSCHIDSPEEFKQLLGPALGIPPALKGRQVFLNFVERNPVTPVIRAWRTKRHSTATENLPHYLCDLPDPVIMSSVTDIEYL
ncbi:MAG: hypothetical protein WBZ19_15755, partial [Chthoniobacterales bacterium]